MPSYGVALDGDHLAASARRADADRRPRPRPAHIPRPARRRPRRRRRDLVHALPRDRRRTMRVVATAGHVDHGKSSLVLALTGTDPDRFEEEKRRGLTIDLGFAHTTLPSGAGDQLHRRARPCALPAQHAGRRRRCRCLPVRGRRDRGVEAAVRGAPPHPRTARASATAWSPSPRSTWSTTRAASWPSLDIGDHVAGDVPRTARRSCRCRRRPVRVSTSCASALDDLVATTPQARRPSATATVDRPRVRRQGERHRRDRHPHRRVAAPATTRSWSSPAGGRPAFGRSRPSDRGSTASVPATGSR